MRQDGVLFAHRTVLNCDVIIENDLCQFGGFLYHRAFGFAASPGVTDGATPLSGESSRRAEAEIMKNDLLHPHGLEVSGPPALLHFSRRIDVVVWPPAVVAE